MKFHRFFILIILLGSAFQSFSGPDIDSLNKALPAMQDDTNKVNALNTIAMSNRDKNPTLAITRATEALELARKLRWKPGMAMAYNVRGICYRTMAKYPEALESLFQSLKINEELKDEGKAAKNLGNIGNLYRDLKDYAKAMEYLKRAYAANEKVSSSIGMTNNLSDMGIVSAELKDYKASLAYFEKAIKIAEATGDKEGVAIVLGNIANVSTEQKNVAKAIEYFNKSLEINKELNRVQGIVTNMMNLAALHYKIAVDSLQVAPGGQIPVGKKANLAKAIDYFQQSIPIYNEVSHLDGLQNAYKGLSEAYSAAGDYKKAMEALEISAKLSDSISSTDDNVKLAQLGEERAQLEKQQQVKINQLQQIKRRNETIAWIGGVVLLLLVTFFVAKERSKSDRLLLNILPAEVAHELKKKGDTEAKYFDEVTVLFTDFVNFTVLAEKLTPQALVDELHTCFKAFDEITSRHKIEKIKTVGDAYLAVSGLPAKDKNHARNIVKAAKEIVAFVADRRQQLGENTFEIRIGVHSGSVVAGIVGVKKFAYDIWGDTVNTAARMEQTSEAGRINISEATYELIKNDFKFTPRGKHEVKNKGLMEMYFVD
jgi:class 3 adenylate cyclase/Tfp pilus assembly protein PilF